MALLSSLDVENVQQAVSSSTIIGHIIDVQGNQLTSALVEDDQGRTPTVTIGDEDILVGQLGSYVAVRQNDVHIIAVVTRMTEQELLALPTIETPGEDTARLPFAKRIARLTPVGAITPSGQFERGIGRYPTTGGCSTGFNLRASPSALWRPTRPSACALIRPICSAGTLQSLGKRVLGSHGRLPRWCRKQSA